MTICPFKVNKVNNIYIAESLAYPNCPTVGGETCEDAIINLEKVLKNYIASQKEDN